MKLTQRTKFIIYAVLFLVLAGLVGIYGSRRTVVINRREEIRIDEGINNADIINRTKVSLVTVYSHQGTPGSKNFRINNLVTGLIVTSDGIIAAPTAGLAGENQFEVILTDGRIAPAEFVDSDNFSGLSFLKVALNDLPVIRQGFSEEALPAERVLCITSSSADRGTWSWSALVSTPSVPIPSLTKIYDFSSPNAFMHLDLSLDLEKLGCAVIDRDGALLGVASQIGREIVVLRAEDLKSSLDSFLQNSSAEAVKFAGSYNILSSSQAEFLQLPSRYGIWLHLAPAPLALGDFVYSVDGKELSDIDNFQRLLLQKKSGDVIKMRVVRSGQEREIEIKL